MSDRSDLYRFEHSSEMPSLETYDHIRYLLRQLGVPTQAVSDLPPGVVSFIADHLLQINDLKDRVRTLQERLQEAEFDVIRLRGQRNALRSTLMKSKAQDPMLGYASDHMLEAITEVHIRKKPEAVASADKEAVGSDEA